jgi:ribonuclease P protein component
LHCTALDVGAVTQQASLPQIAPASALFVVQDVWMGAMVPKRWAKRAVTRNAIKRQIYCVSAEFKAELPVAAHVVRLRLGFDKKQFMSATSDLLKATVRQELQQLFAKVATRASVPNRQSGAI